MEPYLDECMASVIAQTIFQEMEVLLVENGSSDNSLTICNRYAEQYPQIKVLINKETGLSEARNYGVRFANAPWIGFVDSDDTIDPDMFDTLLRAVKENQADCAYCNYQLENEGKLEKFKFHDTGKTRVRPVADVVHDIFLEESTSAAWVRILRKSFLEKHQFPRGVFYEDHASIYRWMSELNKIVHVSRPLYHYFVREGSITQTTNNDMKKLIDFFDADLNRIPFIKDYDGFSYQQRRHSMRHIVKMCIMHFKRYIAMTPEINPHDPILLRMRSGLIDATRHLPHDLIGSKNKRSLFEISHLWRYYYWRRRRRRNRYLKEMEQK